jgi:hypothetical protein
MKVQNSVSKSTYLPDQKSICEKYGLYITNPARKRKKKKREFREEKGRKPKYRYRYRPRTHYYEPEDIKLKTHTHQARQQALCWICGKSGHLAYNCPENIASRKSKGKLSEQKAKEAQEKNNWL